MDCVLTGWYSTVEEISEPLIAIFFVHHDFCFFSSDILATEMFR